MQNFRDLKVWQKSHKLAMAIHKATRSFPKEERYELTIQLWRAAVSVPTNIAEGCGRSGRRELGRFLTMSAGSASEVEYLIYLAFELGYLSNLAWKQLNTDVTEVKRMLSGFIGTLEVAR